MSNNDGREKRAADEHGAGGGDGTAAGPAAAAEDHESKRLRLDSPEERGWEMGSTSCPCPSPNPGVRRGRRGVTDPLLYDTALGFVREGASPPHPPPPSPSPCVRSRELELDDSFAGNSCCGENQRDRLRTPRDTRDARTVDNVEVLPLRLLATVPISPRKTL